MEFISISGKTEYISMGYGIVPLFRLSQNEVILFDSGTEKSPELIDYFKFTNTHVHSILCTHLHPDHVANSQELHDSHCSIVYGPACEVDDSRQRWGWTHPINGITTESSVTIAGHQFPILHTPGHSAGHLCYTTPDGVFIAGDAFMTQSHLQISKIPYMEDVDESILSMEAIRQTDCPLYAVAHKGIISKAELSTILDENIQKELDLYEVLRHEIRDGMPVEDLITHFIRAAGVYTQKMVDEGYVRLTSRVRVLSLAAAGEYTISEGIVHSCH